MADEVNSPEYSSEIVEQARKAIKMLGLELVERHIKEGQDFRRIYRQLDCDIRGPGVEAPSHLEHGIPLRRDVRVHLGADVVDHGRTEIGQGVHAGGDEIGMVVQGV